MTWRPKGLVIFSIGVMVVIQSACFIATHPSAPGSQNPACLTSAAFQVAIYRNRGARRL
jgi:hypothetical protein